MLVVAEQIWWFENLRICLMFQVQFACPLRKSDADLKKDVVQVGGKIKIYSNGPTISKL